MSGDYTRVGFLFWDWEPVRHLDPIALKLWMVLYTKSVIPGLWCGDVMDLSSQSYLTPEQTLSGLDVLLGADLIEFDRNVRVLRLTKLPDAGEWPSSPNIIRSWWKTFTRKIPQCDIRDAHVTTMRWLLDEGAWQAASNRSQKPTPAHEAMWAETFGTIAIPLKRSRGVRRFSDSDTSTANQPSLFAPKRTSGGGGDAIPDPIPQCPPAEPPPKIRSETITHTLDPIAMGSGEGEGAGEGVLDLSSGSASGSGSGETTSHANVIPFPRSPDVLRALIGGFATRVNEARARVAAAHQMHDARPVRLMGGVREATLLDRLKESSDPRGDLEHVIAVAEAEALAEPEKLRWLSWSLAEAKAWDQRLAATPSSVRARPAERNVFKVVADTVAEMDWSET